VVDQDGGEPKDPRESIVEFRNEVKRLVQLLETPENIRAAQEVLNKIKAFRRIQRDLPAILLEQLRLIEQRLVIAFPMLED
jgi:hypothetical protein